MYNPHSKLHTVTRWASREGYTCYEVTMSNNIPAILISADDAPVFGAVEDFCRRSRWRYVCEVRNYHSAAVYLADDFRRLARISEATHAAADLFFAARTGRADLPAYRAAAAALGLDPDACAAVGVDAVPADYAAV